MPEVAAAVSAMPAAAVSVAAVSVTALGLGGRIRRGHQQTGYADGGEAIDSDQSAQRQAAGQEFSRSALCVPDHFITFLQFPVPRAEIRCSRANLAARRISFLRRVVVQLPFI